MVRTTYAFPAPNALEQFIRSGVSEITTDLSKQQLGRICGLGVAALEMWGWEAEVGAPHEVLEAWRAYDIRASVEKARSLARPLLQRRDGSWWSGTRVWQRRTYANFLYIFMRL